MSIPPLVCSTPPPPEQCVDDKDPDSDLDYNSSQEEDENNDYEFGNFSTFNVHTSDINKTHNLLSAKTNVEDLTCSNLNSEKGNEKEGKDTLNPISNLPFEDDVHVEDLNLVINQETITSISTKCSPEVCLNDSDEKIEKDLQEDIPVEGNSVSQSNYKLNNLNEDNVIESVLCQMDKAETPVQESDKINIENEGACNAHCNNQNNDVLYKESMNEEEQNPTDDDFENFDEFKFIRSNDKTEIVVDSNDPWANSTTEDVDFGEFTANFENEDSASSLHMQVKEESSLTQTQSEYNNNDFGEFDEFKSSMSTNTDSKEPVELEQNSQVPVLNFQSSNDNQIIESINKVLESIFPEEISNSSDELKNKLDISLGETWSYLKETDNRQPYMVNWNNSLAQTTLLKALCIDSRNILFGPKWSFNTPKYAANLSVAPLQPQKPASQMTTQREESVDSDKTINKSAWADPFASDGQESCNVESETNIPDIGPTDLDVFEAAMSTKADKIYSSTLNIQPIRQISLPDTHIFTPTDSETPRSKTIHYNSNSAHNILVPQPVGSVKTQQDEITSQPAEKDLQTNGEYWDFQEFKSSDIKSLDMNKKLETDNKDTSVKANCTLETQVLQPIKMEPIMPTLNWPDPGEVKEVFDDFSDFVSKSISVDDKQISLSEIHNETKNENNCFKDTSLKTNEIIEDDFDMFQSALPTNIIKVNSENSFPNNASFIIKADFDPEFSKLEPIKSDDISILKIRPTENAIQIVGNSSNSKSQAKELKIKTESSGMQVPSFNLLQPITSSTTQQMQQNSGQILQPLSLEGYSQINWPNPGIDLQDLSKFNPVESLQSLKSDMSNHSKNASPVHNHKSVTNIPVPDEDIWGDFVSIKPKPQPAIPKKQAAFADDDEWTDFVSSPSVNTQNGLNTISLNVDTISGIQKSSNSTKYPLKSNDMPVDIPTLNYITPKTTNQKSFNERHFQNL